MGIYFMMERIIKKEILKQCELIYTKNAKQFIIGKPIKTFTVYKKDGTSYKRTEKTPWPVNEIARRNAKKFCGNLFESLTHK